MTYNSKNDVQSLKNILSSQHPAAIKQIVGLLPDYVRSAPNQRTAIKDILSSQCSEAIKQIVTLLPEYVRSAAEDERRTAIKDILSSQCSEAISAIKDYRTYSDDSDEESLVRRILQDCSSPSNASLAPLFNDRTLSGGRETRMEWYWRTQPDVEGRTNLLMKILASGNQHAITTFWTHFCQFNQSNSVGLPFFNYIFLKEATEKKQNGLKDYPFVKRIISSQQMKLVDLLFNVQTRSGGWLSLVPAMQEGQLLWDCFHSSLLVKILMHQRKDFVDTITSLNVQHSVKNYANVLKWAVFSQLWGLKPAERHAFYQQSVKPKAGKTYPPAPQVSAGSLGAQYEHRPPTPPPSEQNHLTFIARLGYGGAMGETVQKRITQRGRGEIQINPPAPKVRPCTDSVMCINCRVAFYQGELFVLKDAADQTAQGKPCPLCDTHMLSLWNPSSTIPAPQEPRMQAPPHLTPPSQTFSAPRSPAAANATPQYGQRPSLGLPLGVNQETGLPWTMGLPPPGLPARVQYHPNIFGAAASHPAAFTQPQHSVPHRPLPTPAAGWSSSHPPAAASATPQYGQYLPPLDLPSLLDEDFELFDSPPSYSPFTLSPSAEFGTAPTFPPPPPLQGNQAPPSQAFSAPEIPHSIPPLRLPSLLDEDLELFDSANLPSDWPFNFTAPLSPFAEFGTAPIHAAASGMASEPQMTAQQSHEEVMRIESSAKRTRPMDPHNNTGAGTATEEESIRDILANASQREDFYGPCPADECTQKPRTRNGKFCTTCASKVFHKENPDYKLGTASGDGNNCLIDSILQQVVPGLSRALRLREAIRIRAVLISSNLAMQSDFLGTPQQIRVILEQLELNPEQYRVITTHLGAGNKLMNWTSFAGAHSDESVGGIKIWLWDHELIHFVPVRKKQEN